MILLGLQTQAQTIADWFRGPTRKELSAENDRLRAGMDSLRFLVDSLERSRLGSALLTFRRPARVLRDVNSPIYRA